MVHPIDQIRALASNPTGMPGMSEQEQYVAALEEEIAAQKQRTQDVQFGMAQQLQAAASSRSQLPGEKELHYLLDSQPKLKDTEETIDWDEWTIDESEIMRHVQLGVWTEAYAKKLFRDYHIITILREQPRKRQVAINRSKKLHREILMAKGTIHEGRSTVMEMIINPSQKSEIRQHITEGTGGKPTGFLGGIFGKR